MGTLQSGWGPLGALCKVGGAHWGALCKVGGAHGGGGQGTGMLSLLHCFLLRREVTSVGQTVTWHSTCRTWSCSARSWMHSSEHRHSETGQHLLLVVPSSSLSHPAHLTLPPCPPHSPTLPTSLFCHTYIILLPAHLNTLLQSRRADRYSAGAVNGGR